MAAPTTARRGRCAYDHKTTYSTYDAAAKVARRLPVKARVYWCPVAGGWHCTSMDPADYDRQQAVR